MFETGLTQLENLALLKPLPENGTSHWQLQLRASLSTFAILQLQDSVSCIQTISWSRTGHSVSETELRLQGGAEEAKWDGQFHDNLNFPLEAWPKNNK